MNIITIAWILLVLRALGVGVILYIIFRITYPNLRAENDPHVKPVRWVLFGFSLIFLLGNIIPIIVDAGTLWGGIYRPTTQLGFTLTSYTLNNAISHLIYSIAFLVLFLTSEKANAKLKTANSKLQGENATLKEKKGHGSSSKRKSNQRGAARN